MTRRSGRPTWSACTFCGCAGCWATPEGHVLITRAPGYQLLVQPGDVDAECFETLVAVGRKALHDGDGALAAEELGQALELWRGRALADVPPSPLVSAEADRLEESRLAALELRIEADLACGRHAQLVSELRRLLSDQPLREGLWNLLIRALDGAGRHAEALAAYGQVREVIAEELGVDPGPELQRLYQDMLVTDVGLRGERSSMAGDEGASTTRRSGSGESAGKITQTPPTPRVPAQLPADVEYFTGRHSHMARLRRLLTEVQSDDTSETVRVAVMAGTPGVGKTALAIHAAHALRQEFP